MQNVPVIRCFRLCCHTRQPLPSYYTLSIPSWNAASGCNPSSLPACFCGKSTKFSIRCRNLLFALFASSAKALSRFFIDAVAIFAVILHPSGSRLLPHCSALGCGSSSAGCFPEGCAFTPQLRATTTVGFPWPSLATSCNYAFQIIRFSERSHSIQMPWIFHQSVLVRNIGYITVNLKTVVVNASRLSSLVWCRHSSFPYLLALPTLRLYSHHLKSYKRGGLPCCICSPVIPTAQGDSCPSDPVDISTPAACALRMSLQAGVDLRNVNSSSSSIGPFRSAPYASTEYGSGWSDLWI